MVDGAGEDQILETRLLGASQTGVIEEAAELLMDGFLVVFPTDTVYGVGAAIHNNEALLKLFKAKERPLSKGIPILIAEKGDLNKIAAGVPDEITPLIEKFWPGPLSLIVPKRSGLPSALSPNEGVAVRLPDNRIARDIISAAGGALAVSSANLSGKTPSCSGQEAYSSLSGRVSLIIDGGQSPGGIASTVLNCLEMPPRLERQGPITIRQIERYLAIKS